MSSGCNWCNLKKLNALCIATRMNNIHLSHGRVNLHARLIVPQRRFVHGISCCLDEIAIHFQTCAIVVGQDTAEWSEVRFDSLMRPHARKGGDQVSNGGIYSTNNQLIYNLYEAPADRPKVSRLCNIARRNWMLSCLVPEGCDM